MATVATKLTDGQRRIITKVVDGQRRVSCSCCETGCCLYPASGFGVNYGEDDLPDSINLIVEGQPEIIRGTASKEGAPYFYTFSNVVGLYDSSANIRVSHGGNRWLVEADLGDGFEDTGNLNDFEGVDCLLYRNMDAGGVIVFTDNFADTYTVNTYDEFVSGTPASSFTITRQSLCVWSGFDGRYNEGTNVQLTYNTPNENSTRASMWTIEVNGRVDGGPYNSPEGVYSDGNYVWEVVP
jgi:hypothetical protein